MTEARGENQGSIGAGCELMYCSAAAAATDGSMGFMDARLLLVDDRTCSSCINKSIRRTAAGMVSQGRAPSIARQQAFAGSPVGP